MLPSEIIAASSILWFTVCGAVAGGRLRGQAILGGCAAPLLVLLAAAALNGHDGFTGLHVFAVAAILELSVLCILPDRRKRCAQCGSVLHRGAKMCHACRTPARLATPPRRKQPAALQPCPYCGKKIDESRLHSGTNSCPFCGETFVCSE